MTILEQMGASAKQAARVLMNAGAKKDAALYAIAEALPLIGRKIHGFDCPDAVMTAPETRSSSPVRILRDDSFQSSARGVYPCGEGAGYAGGIMSSAVDGMKAAEAVIDALSD